MRLVPAGTPPPLTQPRLKMSISWIVDWHGVRVKIGNGQNRGTKKFVQAFKEIEGLLTLKNYFSWIV